jgi:hypothetical protein
MLCLTDMANHTLHFKYYFIVARFIKGAARAICNLYVKQVMSGDFYLKHYFFTISRTARDETGVIETVDFSIPGSRNFTMLS